MEFGLHSSCRAGNIYAVPRLYPGTGMQAQMQGLFYLVPPYQLVPWFGSPHLLVSLVQEKTSNLGCSVHARRGSFLQFSGDLQVLDLLDSWSCWWKRKPSMWAVQLHLSYEALCSSQEIVMHWICWFPGLLGGREDVESGLQGSSMDGKISAVPR